MKDTKNILIVVLLLCLVATLTALLTRSSKTETIYKDRVIEKEVLVEVPVETIVEKEIITYVKSDNSEQETDSLKLSSDVYTHQDAFIKEIKWINGKEIAVVDILTLYTREAKGDSPEEGFDVIIKNENLRTRNYLVTKGTHFSSNPNGPHEENLKEFFQKGNSQPTYITSNAQGELIKVVVPTAG